MKWNECICRVIVNQAEMAFDKPEPMLETLMQGLRVRDELSKRHHITRSACLHICLFLLFSIYHILPSFFFFSLLCLFWCFLLSCDASSLSFSFAFCNVCSLHHPLQQQTTNDQKTKHAHTHFFELCLFLFCVLFFVWGGGQLSHHCGHSSGDEIVSGEGKSRHHRTVEICGVCKHWGRLPASHWPRVCFALCFALCCFGVVCLYRVLLFLFFCVWGGSFFNIIMLLFPKQPFIHSFTITQIEGAVIRNGCFVCRQKGMYIPFVFPLSFLFSSSSSSVSLSPQPIQTSLSKPI